MSAPPKLARWTFESSRPPTVSSGNEIAAGRFRADLYFRLSVIPLRIAPLRERREDIIPLARHFLNFHSTDAGRPLMLSPEAEEALLNHPWPGNVRELENVIERAVVMSGQETLTPDAFAFEERLEEDEPNLAPTTSGVSARAAGRGSATATSRARTTRGTRSRPPSTALRQFESKPRSDNAGGNRNDAATMLGVDRTTLSTA